MAADRALDGIPDNGRAEIPIGVYGEVAKIDLPLGDFRMTARDLRRNLVCSFADDSSVTGEGLCRAIISEAVLIFHGTIRKQISV